MNRDKWPHCHRGYSFRYAPIKAIDYWFDNLRAFFRRGRMGWSYGDAWDIDTYLGIVIPGLLRHMANYGMGCPMEYVEKYPNDDEAAHQAWKNDLNHIANLIEFANSDNDDYNKYAEAYWEACGLGRTIKKTKNGIKTTITVDDTLKNNYYQEARLICEKQQAAIEEAMNWIGKHWFNLWD